MEKGDIQILHRIFSLIIFKSLENMFFGKDRAFQPIHITGKKNNYVIA
jgi:hypothetical protein